MTGIKEFVEQGEFGEQLSSDLKYTHLYSQPKGTFNCLLLFFKNMISSF